MKTPQFFLLGLGKFFEKEGELKMINLSQYFSKHPISFWSRVVRPGFFNFLLGALSFSFFLLLVALLMAVFGEPLPSVGR